MCMIHLCNQISHTLLQWFISYHCQAVLHTKFQDPILSGASVSPTSQVCICHVGITDCRKLKSMSLG